MLSLPELLSGLLQVLPNISGFAWRDLTNSDAYKLRTQADIAFATQVPVITLLGAGSYAMRWRDVGRACHFEMELVSTVSLAMVAGVSYFRLPLPANTAGRGGLATMYNKTTNVAVGVCAIDLTNTRCYMPAQAASPDTFQISGWYPTP